MLFELAADQGPLISASNAMSSEQLVVRMSSAIGSPPPGVFSAQKYTAFQNRREAPLIETINLSSTRGGLFTMLLLSKSCVQWVADSRPTAEQCVEYLHDPKGLPSAALSSQQQCKHKATSSPAQTQACTPRPSTPAQSATSPATSGSYRHANVTFYIFLAAASHHSIVIAGSCSIPSSYL